MSEPDAQGIAIDIAFAESIEDRDAHVERMKAFLHPQLTAEIERLRDDNASLRDQVAQLLREAQEREARILAARKAVADVRASEGMAVNALALRVFAALDRDAPAGEEP